jgi:hypothetical protein
MYSYYALRKGNCELMAVDCLNVSFCPSFIPDSLLLELKVREGADMSSGYIYVDSSQYLRWLYPFEAMLRDAFFVSGSYLFFVLRRLWKYWYRL